MGATEPTPFHAVNGSPVAWVVDWLATLPRQPLRRAVVLTASERLAHAIRHEACVERAAPGCVAGVEFLRPVEMARALLAQAGEPRRLGWEALRPGRLLHVLQGDSLQGTLAYFDAAQLRSGPGYADALVATIADLERAGLDPDGLDALAADLDDDRRGAARLRDVATVWRRADADRGDYATAAQILGAAIALLAGWTRASPPRTGQLSFADALAARATAPCLAVPPTCVVLDATPPASLLAFVRALPGAVVVFHDARPVRTTTHRWRAAAEMAPAEPQAMDSPLGGNEDARENDQARRLPVASPLPAPPRGEGQGEGLDESKIHQATTPAFGRVPSPQPSPREIAGRGGQEHTAMTGQPPDREAGHIESWDTGHALQGVNELSVLRRYLFETPECLAAAERPRSAGPDGSVVLEEHAGVEAEVEAAVGWVIDRIAHGTPLEQIAVIIPEKSSYAVTVAERLARVGGGVPAYVAGGLALAFTPAGRRLRTLLDAIAGGLEIGATLRLVPALRRSGQAADAAASRLSASRTAEVVYAAGIAGGGRGDRDGTTEWLRKLTAHRQRLRAIVETADAVAANDRLRTVTAHNAHRWLRDVEPILPAFAALDELAAQTYAGGTLHSLWQGIENFARRHLLLPPDPPDLVARLAEAMAPALSDPVIATLPARQALRWIQQRLHLERQPYGRFGEARVFVGTAAQAAGLEFAAVRILGLAEGGMPPSAHDDPIVPDELRGRIDAAARRRDPAVIVPRLADTVLDEIHAIFRCITAARDQLSLSTPRQWVDRSEREVSGIILEVATALGRGHMEDGDVPTAGRLRAAYFADGERRRLAAVCRWPLRPADEWVRLTNGGGAPAAVPVAWMAPDAVSVERTLGLLEAGRSPQPSGIDGVLGDIWQQWPELGGAQRPLSASALALLLGCPHRFLLERLLHWHEPPQRPTTDAIEPGTYGTLFHHVAETLLREVGAALCRREGSPEWWARRARELAEQAFDELVAIYPLRGRATRERERERLSRQIESLVRDEWERPSRTFVGAEVGFGRDAPVSVAAGERPLFLWGAIDRIDRLDDGSLSVRDLKTGRVRDLAEEEVHVGRDLQIGVYTLVAEELFAASERVPARVGEAAYVHPSAAQAPERAFRAAQLDGLRSRTREWLQVAAGLLDAGAFARTPHPENCRTCPFVPACGDEAQARSRSKLQTVDPVSPLARFATLSEPGGFEP